MVLRHWSRATALSGPASTQDPDLFTGDDPKRIADAVKCLAEARAQGRTSPFRSAMSMLSFHINLARDTLSPDRRRILEAAKDELRRAYGKA